MQFKKNDFFKQPLDLYESQILNDASRHDSFNERESDCLMHHNKTLRTIKIDNHL